MVWRGNWRGAATCWLQLWEACWHRGDEHKPSVPVQLLRRIQGVPKILCRAQSSHTCLSSVSGALPLEISGKAESKCPHRAVDGGNGLDGR